MAVSAGDSPSVETSVGASKSNVLRLSLGTSTESEFRWDSELHRVERCLAILDVRALWIYEEYIVQVCRDLLKGFKGLQHCWQL